jgi:glycosyltransferase involved in cell wall biosynthesis
MRIGILSPSPWTNTGYGIQSAALIKTLQALGHDVACFAFTGLSGSPLSWGGAAVYPSLYHPLGQDMAMHARHFGADIVIPVMDIWNLEPRAWEGIKLVPYFPVDHFPLSPHIAKVASACFSSVVYSKFGQKQCDEAGVQAHYIPCSVDTTIYAPTDRSEARSALGWPQDRYIVGMVQANVGRPSRKAFEPQLRAFKLFQEEHKDALLYLHTFLNAGRETDGENLIGMLASVGLELGRDVLIPDQYIYTLGMPPEQLAICYNAMNVLLQVTTGEGFGVPLVEAQACGTPVICGGWTSMPELCFAGWMVPHDEDDKLWGTLEGYKVFPRVSAIVEELEKAYRARIATTKLRTQASAFALPFDIKTVGERYWKPFLAELEARIG